MEIIQKNLQEKKQKSFTRWCSHLAMLNRNWCSGIFSSHTDVNMLVLAWKGHTSSNTAPQICQRELRNLELVTSNAGGQNKAVRFSAAPASILKMQLLILLSLSSLSFSRSRLLHQSPYCRGLSCSLHRCCRSLYRVTQPTAKPGYTGLRSTYCSASWQQQKWAMHIPCAPGNSSFW